MSVLLRPGRKLVDRLGFTQKLLLLGGLFLVPLLILLKTVISAELEVIDFAAREREGVQLILPLRDLLQAAQGHRGTAQLVLGGNPEARAKLADFQARAQAALAKGDQVDQAAGAHLETTATWKAVKTAWEDTRNNALLGSQGDSFARHGVFIDAVLAAITAVADASYLTLDPELVSYYLMDSLTVRLPRLAETAGKLRGLGSGILTRGAVTQEELVTVNLLLSHIQEDTASLEGNYSKVFGANPESREALATAVSQARSQLDALAGMVEKEVLGKGRTGLEPAAYFAKGTAAVDGVYDLFDRTAPELDRLLLKRVTDNQARMTGTLAMLALAMFLVAYLFWSLRDGLMEAVHHVHDGARRMLLGQFDEPFAVASRDELGSIGASLDEMQSQLRARIEQERAEAAANLRIRIALDSSAVGITISDERALLIHMTPSARSLLQLLLGRGGNVDGLPGTKLSAIFTDPAAAERFDHAVVSGEEVDLVFNGRHLRLVARPIRDQAGNVLGRVTQWLDRTEEVSVEKAVAGLVEAAAAGDFSQRLDATGKDGFFRQLAEGIN
ncbi:MAG: HAMP domain-containing protein, partial [Pseudomonadota bacterium]